MYQLIYESLVRQGKGLELLLSLLKQEYRSICDRKMDIVAGYEFSIHELIRQLVNEKEFVVGLLGGVRVRDYAQSLNAEEGQALLDQARFVDMSEQNASKQATRNSQLSLGLLDLNEKTLQELFKQVTADGTTIYGRRGSVRHSTTQGAIISGRL